MEHTLKQCLSSGCHRKATETTPSTKDGLKFLCTPCLDAFLRGERAGKRESAAPELLKAIVKLQGIMSLNDPTSFIRDNQAHCNGVAKEVSIAISKATK